MFLTGTIDVRELAEATKSGNVELNLPPAGFKENLSRPRGRSAFGCTSRFMVL